jgi:hypothetical protein
MRNAKQRIQAHVKSSSSRRTALPGDGTATDAALSERFVGSLSSGEQDADQEKEKR